MCGSEKSCCFVCSDHVHDANAHATQQQARHPWAGPHNPMHCLCRSVCDELRCADQVPCVCPCCCSSVISAEVKLGQTTFVFDRLFPHLAELQSHAVVTQPHTVARETVVCRTFPGSCRALRCSGVRNRGWILGKQQLLLMSSLKRYTATATLDQQHTAGAGSGQ